MKIALAQINTTVGDFDRNVDLILKFSRRAHEHGASVVLFPELAVCGYPPRDLVERKDFICGSELSLAQLASRLPPILALVGYVRRSHAKQGKPVCNAAALIDHGRVVLDYPKKLLPFYDVFDESRYFEPGRESGLYEFGGRRIALSICEDVWNDKNFWKQRLYTQDPVEEAVSAGAQILFNIASSPYNAGKIQLRHDMLRAIAVERKIPVAYVNHVGGNDQLIFDGSSMAFGPDGELLARARSFEEDLVVFSIDGALRDCHQAPISETESVYRALQIGTRDYVKKCGFREAIVGLSGGIDSSLVATLAVDALGPKCVRGVAMPGPYSSSGSLRDAEILARNLGIDFRVIPIEPVFDSYLQTLDPVFEGKPRDVTEENIQARIRGNVLMALSNKFDALVLSTGNKSELAVGYCTLYGDMAGGLAVIADVPKTMVYELARYANRERHRIPQACFEKPPSAELRPDQTDQETLPPYEVLDPILAASIEERLCKEEIAERYGFAPELVADVLRRVARAEYKRQQAAPVLRVTAKAFGMGRRYPIAQKFDG